MKRERTPNHPPRSLRTVHPNALGAVTGGADVTYVMSDAVRQYVLGVGSSHNR
ncbi:MAG TPA: hypothetical protein VMZ28_21130 [Kofleriaceae bacterium]|nr:hypothetical protein [Kofleriaceae bacterium]